MELTTSSWAWSTLIREALSCIEYSLPIKNQQNKTSLHHHHSWSELSKIIPFSTYTNQRKIISKSNPDLLSIKSN
jgi:hypothetical protein